jgi:hypothetical protein
MDRIEFWTLFLLLLWIAYDTRQIQKELKALRETLDKKHERR